MGWGWGEFAQVGWGRRKRALEARTLSDLHLLIRLCTFLAF